MKEIQLFAPNEQPIIGAVAADGSIRAFQYSYDKSNDISRYLLEEGGELPPGQVVLQDASGKNWNATDVEWHTLFKRST